MKHHGIEVFNLGTGRGYSVLELISIYERVNGIKIPFVIAPRRPGDLPESYADATKAETLLGWKTMLTIEDMCRDSFSAANIAEDKLKQTADTQ
jgi:UDP-glucose 4-epimerase